MHFNAGADRDLYNILSTLCLGVGTRNASISELSKVPLKFPVGAFGRGAP